MTRPLLISIEGNIGAGKTTILKMISDMYSTSQDKIVFLKEPVELWYNIKDESGKTMLENFYENPKKNAFAFQIMACVTRTSIIKNAMKEHKNCEIVLCERSIEADSKIFAKMLYDDGLMSKMEHSIYMLLYNENIADYSVDGIIYISTNPDKCYERVQKRNREGESNIEMDYLVKCDKYHMDWLLDDHIDNNSNILELDTSKDIDILNPKQYQFWVNKISSFIDDVKKGKMEKEN
uniref:Deoxynucleoside kinase domain-containing protein n=1 Tax=viral metagenome TaxID=1070528 RepID=A0A6C0AU65_9ZZZZ|tara:strand:- start:3754 stop:4461 length:708 start_codon:yes stop_codon:yes gene_type:complete